MYLGTYEPPVRINSMKDLGDGKSLVLLMQKLLSKEHGQQVKIKHHANPRTLIHEQENIKIALIEAEKAGIRLSVTDRREFISGDAFIFLIK